ncbi:hypothetical protein U14_00053 [Candidatus Moduliflexus flocculans]|uniref:CAAX prenyl protease 2/Lysostaphin resistance protein A-like domain-containing protein n=1 Tax=Candidatus Moduliflexus flocculans TaxID=1499966 RepID=A0A0S6VPA0_9BACT|nr:hypothetical protein U14_00053 [Candidatus Moduliflexus flocculans]
MNTQTLKLAVAVEGGLLAVALIWASFQRLPLRAALTLTPIDLLAGMLAGVGLLAANYAMITHGSRYCAFFRRIKTLLDSDVIPLFRHLDLTTSLVISLLSGFAEELFFRGVLQANVGLWLASAIFGAAHIWKKEAIVYGVYASIIGVAFGGCYQWRGNLWMPILVHIVNNFGALLYYAHHQQQRMKEANEFENLE